jgi:hypothetical protein
MAVGYLRLIQAFAEATGNRELFYAPASAKKIQTIPIEESNQHAHFIYDIALSKHVLRNSDIYPQDHFLDRLIRDCDQEKVKWVKLFVEKSPEFLDGTNHTASRKDFKVNIDKFTSIIDPKGPNDIIPLILEALSEKNCSTLTVAKSVVRLRFTQILEDILGTNVIVNDELLFGNEIFTPTIRIKSTIYRLNESTNQFVLAYIPRSLQDDESFMLPILSLFYMASAPILASLVSFFNFKKDMNKISDASAYAQFKMIPTNYVAREAAQDAELDSVHIRKGDKLYVMLFESTGCPFSDAASMPFGYGKHFCPGSDLSKLIINQCIQAFNAIPIHELCKLSSSSLEKGRGAAFLSFGDSESL